MSLDIMQRSLLLLVALVCAGFSIACIRRPLPGVAGLILLFLFAPLYPVPGFEYVFYGFALCSSFILFVWLVNTFRRMNVSEKNDNYRPLSSVLKKWFLMCFLGLPLSLLFNRGHFDERLYYFVKGILPFWYLCSFFILLRLKPQIPDAERVLRYLLITASGLGGLSWLIYIATAARVTWFYHPLAFPFMVLGSNIAFVYFLSSQKLSRQLSWAGLIAFLLAATIFTFTKAQMVALFCGFAIVIAILHGPSSPTVLRKAMALGFSGLLASIVLAFCLAHNEVDSFTEILSARFTDAGTASTRLEEWRDALLEFGQSPIIGKGIGFQLERTEFDETITAGYVHNQVVYTAMTMGLVGLAIYTFILSHWVRLLLRARRADGRRKELLAACHACIFSLLVYALLFASFRTIQHNYLLGILLALTVALTPRSGSAMIA